MKPKQRAVLLWMVYFFNLMILPQFFVSQAADGSFSVNRTIYIVIQVVTFLIAIALYHKTFLEGFKKLRGKSIGRDLVIGYVVRIGLSIVVSLFIPLTQSDNQANVESLFNSTSIVAVFFLTCVFAPVVEELVFREGIIGAFKDRIHPWILAIVSAGLFMLLHSISNAGGIDWMAFVMYLPLTIPIVGMYRLYEDNIAASFLMHFLSNAIAFVALIVTL